MASIFFCLWSSIILYVSVDTFLWNLVHGIVNLALGIPLLLAKIPPKLSVEERFMYDTMFAGKLSKKAFKLFISKARRKRADMGETQLI